MTNPDRRNDLWQVQFFNGRHIIKIVFEEMENFYLTDNSKEALSRLSEMLPEIEPEYLAETAFSLTAALYQKIAEGSIIQVKAPSGKIEELRFKAKRATKKKAKASS